ncbi:MAG: aa3-type cytochrome c oxidase subunit IV [Maricaulis sp.]|jgi:hypothetical protein|nr:aa3-type cytochrome c oxidase subunit IV [Maricaulis sp.]MDG2043316.1 aa3-type cytochrome c oxidase subunit IV [Maricaulis sp.]
MASDHVPGEMDISAQKSTFDGVMNVTVWSSLLLLMGIFYFTLVFATGADWLSALLGVSALTAAFGFLLNLGGAWYITVVGLFLSGLVIGGLSNLAASIW